MWAVVRSLLAVVGLLVALAALAAFVAVVVSAWQVKAETNRQTNEIAAKAHTALNAADNTVVFVRSVIDQADTDLKNAKDTSARPREPANPFLQLTARRATENLVGSVDRANVAVVTASEAAVVAKAALDIFGSDEQLKDVKGWLGVQPEQIAQTRAGLTTATAELGRVRSILGVPLGDGPTQEQLVTVESALAQAREFIEQLSKIVTTARTRVDETKRGIDLWAMRIALGVTVLGVAGAVGQLFLARFCWRVLRGKPA